MAHAAQAYQIKVTLQYSKPPIWRRLLVSPDTRLDSLHVILQVAMLWTNSHLHHFMQKIERRDPTRQEQNAVMTGKGRVDWEAIRGVRFFSDPHFEIDEANDESKVQVDQFLRQPKDKLFYEYDFGDGWVHEIVLEKARAGRRRRPAAALYQGETELPAGRQRRAVRVLRDAGSAQGPGSRGPRGRGGMARRLRPDALRPRPGE
jgi:hypothetical protein